MSVHLKQDHDDKFKPLLYRIKERVMNMTRSMEKGIVNKKAKSSFAMRNNGDINTVASKSAQQKLSANGKSTNIANETVDIANTKKITMDELIINNHKFNNLLFEYTDLKTVNNNKEKLVTGLALETTVLTKCWEPTLKRYVMIRRPARFAMFSPELDVADAPPNLSIDTSLLSEFKDMLDIQAAAEVFDEFSDTTQKEDK